MKLKPEQDDERYQDPLYLRKTAMDYLARREHSEQQLTRKLTGRGFDEELVEIAVAELVADGLLSDARFTEAFVNSRFQRGSGPQKIRMELRERGVAAELASLSIEAFEDQWWQRVREVREKKFGAEQPGDFKERSRQMRFLQQRGFTSEQISGAFKDE
ncbi:MAG: regulatory protein RecX [Gammaproteobacteria bacterium]|nr:regulatory protein RecX [Gammaproteobacteria bacterium]MDX2458514.1 regulatory protein RecX [Gammaproteobacteria bacterium]